MPSQTSDDEASNKCLTSLFFFAAISLLAPWPSYADAVKPAAGTTSDNATKDNSGSSTTLPIVAGDGLPVSKLHIGTSCKTAAGVAVISGDISTRETGWGTGTSVDVWFDKNYLQNVKIEETERQTRLWSDVQALLSSAAAAADPCDQVHITKKLQFKRATVKITGVDLKGNDAQSVTVVSGPPEHAFLGLDLAVTNRNTLKYDAASKSLQPASTSPQLYLSLNYLIGDVLSPAAGFNGDFYKNFSVKIFVGANSHPLNSLGVGLGYRAPEIKLGTFDLSALSVYGGYFWTKQDTTSSTGTVQTNGGTNRGFRFGITFDVASAAKWVKW